MDPASISKEFNNMLCYIYYINYIVVSFFLIQFIELIFHTNIAHKLHFSKFTNIPNHRIHNNLKNSVLIFKLFNSDKHFLSIYIK